MDRPNLFMEDTDFNICLSWICDSTDGQTYSISDHFEKKMKCPEGMNKYEWLDKTMDFFNWQPWEDAIGWKHDYRVDDPTAKAVAERMAKELNAFIDRVNADPDYLHWDDEGVWRMACKKGRKALFTFEYRGKKSDACRFCADLVISELGDGDGENGGKGSLRNCVAEIADDFMTNWCYVYADCTFSMCKVVEEKEQLK